MDLRDLAKGNGVSLSVGPVYKSLMPATNWGVPAGPSFVVVLDPQLNVRSSTVEDAVKLGVELMGRGARRGLMSELANEFAVMRDNLLYELAR